MDNVSISNKFFSLINWWSILFHFDNSFDKQFEQF